MHLNQVYAWENRGDKLFCFQIAAFFADLLPILVTATDKRFDGKIIKPVSNGW